MARIQFDLPDEYPFSTEIVVRITDINYGGHLGNDSLLSMIHEARVQWFNAMGFTELDVGGLGTVMSDSAIQYRSEAFQGECLRFELAAYDFNKYGCDIAYRISERDSGRLVALAKSGLVFFNYAERKVQSRPACFSEALDKLGSD